MERGKYRYRTTLREHLPALLAGRLPKGRRDCGDHEWYLSAEQTWRCYHCEPGITHTAPWDDEELAARELEAEAMQIRAGLERQSGQRVSHG